MADYKVVHDTVHGSIRLGDMGLDLISTPELQRLNNIRQLGLAYLVFPGANHSRIEHSLGVYHIAGKMAEELGVEPEERKLLMASGMLHDIGHGPYSHTLEAVLKTHLGIDHMELTKKIITGGYNLGTKEEGDVGWGRIPHVLEEHGLDPKEVADLVCSEGPAERPLEQFYKEGSSHFGEGKQYLSQIIHGVVDADQIDYLLRDAHYTGVAHGTIDLERLLQTITLFNGDLVVDRKGMTAVEGMLVARALMYSSVYFHKTNRIAQVMAGRAVERLPPEQLPDIYRMVDSDFFKWLTTAGELQSEIARRLKYRQLFKAAYSLTLDDIDEGKKEGLARIMDRKARLSAEDSIAKRAGIPEGHAMIDLPTPELLISEPRIDKTEIKILDKGTIRALSKYSPLARALQRRVVSRWAMVVSCPGKDVEAVRRTVERVLFE